MNNFDQRLESLEKRIQTLQHDMTSARVALRRWRTMAIALLLAIPILSFPQTGRASGGGAAPSLVRRVEILEARIADFHHFSVRGNDICISGANLHIVNGSGITESTNSLGNLIVGYDEPDPTNHVTLNDVTRKMGSHNVVVGIGHGYESYGGIVGGFANVVNAPFACVTGGSYNQAVSSYSCVSGGTQNTAGTTDVAADGSNATVSGGYQNTANGFIASVSGGFSNTATGNASSISGGSYNHGIGNYSSVSGGTDSTAQGENSAVSGGYSNKANGFIASVSGGYSNTATGNASSISGGSYNQGVGNYSSVSGGTGSTAQGENSAVSGGYMNWALGFISSVCGGEGNHAQGTRSSISGGYQITTDTDANGGAYQWSAGRGNSTPSTFSRLLTN